MAKGPPYPPQIASDQPPAAPREYPVVSQQQPPQSSSQRPAVPHHSSPVPGDVQKPYGGKPLARSVTGTVRKAPDVPQHIVRHPNPVGRPKNPRY